ncbi:MAG TPA: tRNA lysidine(34) synthetase TilS [Verrucomicrobiales bacterium]|nr:tRNA lysidine(34) synthetase TilS [Verrucomicrobiales bacterium]
MDPFCQAVERAIVEARQIPPRARVLVAVSGGIDSVTLLHALHTLAPLHEWTLVVAHFNHGLRGGESDGDERFVARLATRLGLRIQLGRGDVAAHARAGGLSIEMAARELRLAFLARAAVAANCKRVATAHHADDQVELFLLRASRGAGGEGLGGMRPAGPFPRHAPLRIIRPLLQVSRSQIEEWAGARRLRHREDRSNRSLDPLRNRLRLRVIPVLLRELGPEVRGGVLRSVELVRAEAEYVASVASSWLQGRTPRLRFSRLPLAVQRQVLLQQLHRLGLPAGFAGVEAMRLRPGRPVTLEGGRVVLREVGGRIQVLPKPGRGEFLGEALALEMTAARGGAKHGGARVRWSRRGDVSSRFVRQAKPGVEVFDAARVGTSIVLRHWRPGDRFQPLGMSRPAKVQDLFVNRKVPAPDRRRLLVAECGQGRIFWIEGLPPGDLFKVTPATGEFLVWRWSRNSD